MHLLQLRAPESQVLFQGPATQEHLRHRKWLSGTLACLRREPKPLKGFPERHWPPVLDPRPWGFQRAAKTRGPQRLYQLHNTFLPLRWQVRYHKFTKPHQVLPPSAHFLSSLPPFLPPFETCEKASSSGCLDVKTGRRSGHSGGFRQAGAEVREKLPWKP